MDRLLIVTTRSRLRGVRSFPGMLLATRRVRRQLAATDGVVRWASLLSSPTEFWTITAWRSRHEMQEFMRSDAHGDIMWGFSRLLRSLWLVRWQPTEHEVGTWSGLPLAGSVGSDPGTTSTATAPVVPPLLREAVGADGRISLEASPYARQDRQQLKGVGGAVLRVDAGRWGAPAAFFQLTRHRRRLFADPALLRSIVGLGNGGSCYLLSVWRTPDDARRLLDSDWASAVHRRYGERYWGNEWTPESEFGNWDGLRLRGEQRRVPHGRSGT